MFNNYERLSVGYDQIERLMIHFCVGRYVILIFIWLEHLIHHVLLKSITFRREASFRCRISRL